MSCDAAASAAGGARRGADAEQRGGEGRTAGGRAWAECAGEAGAASGWGAPPPQTAGLRQVLSAVCTAAPPEGRAAWGSGEGAAGGLMAGPTLFLVV